MSSVLSWVIADYRSHPARLIMEIFAWVLSIGCSVTMALTVPHPPFMILYPLFILQCSIFLYTAWTRGSLGMVANYTLLVSIDTFALIKMATL